MDLLEILMGAKKGLQPSIDQEMENLYGGGVTSMLPPQGSVPGFAGGMFGGEGQAPTERWDPPQAQQQSPESYNGNDIVVEGFKPKKRSFLGFLADAYLMSKGGKPLFAERIERKNVDKALRGYVDDPEGAIRRLGQIHGMGPTAVKLHDQYSDNKRADETKARLVDNDNDKRIKSISGLAGVALKNPAERQAAINQYNHRLSTWGLLDQYGLPDDVSDAELEAIAYGVLPMDKQERINYQRQRIDQLERDTNSKIADRAADNAQAATNERGRDARAANAEAGKDRRSQGAPDAASKRRANRVFQSKDGSLVEWDDKGTRVRVTGGPDGAKPRFYIVDMNGKIIPDPNAPKE